MLHFRYIDKPPAEKYDHIMRIRLHRAGKEVQYAEKERAYAGGDYERC